MTTRSALAIIASAFALTIAPPTIVKPSAWAATHLVVVDGPRAGHRWDPALTPQLVEILDCLADDQPHNKVSLRKSAQVGATQVGISWLSVSMVVSPCRMMTIFPTITSVQDFNREKLQPTIDATEILRRRVHDTSSRSSRGSTALSKSFPGGSLTLTGANSTADLRSKTVKKQHRDEIDDWVLDLDGQGDPMEMVEARMISFHAAGDYMVLETSTPTIKGSSRIDDSFEAGDQRYWTVTCPHCSTEQILEFGSDTTRHGLKFNRAFPYEAHYVCVSGCVIAEHGKPAMIRAGRWVARQPGPGRHPSFHLDSLSSLLTTWDKIAEAFLKAKESPARLKAFVNLWLGRSWEEKGEAPDWQRLYARREAYARWTIPVGGLFLTVGSDVQGNGIFYEVVAWGRDRQSWSIDAGFLEGDTADLRNPVWGALTSVFERRYGDSYGNQWQADAFAIDEGFNTNTVRAWARGRPKVFCVKGEDGWYRPALGTPRAQEVTLAGKKARRGVNSWPVGTWPLKAELYAMLRKQGARDGAELDPPGFCHFAEFHDEGFFKMLTAEYLGERKDPKGKGKRDWRGRSVRAWIETGPNHYLDCRIYNMALADHLGIERMSEDEWAALAAQRTAPAPHRQDDLVARMNAPVQVSGGQVSGVSEEPSRPSRREDRLLDGVGRDFLDRI